MRDVLSYSHTDTKPLPWVDAVLHNLGLKVWLVQLHACYAARWWLFPCGYSPLGVEPSEAAKHMAKVHRKSNWGHSATARHHIECWTSLELLAKDLLDDIASFTWPAEDNGEDFVLEHLCANPWLGKTIEEMRLFADLHPASSGEGDANGK